MPFQGLPWTEFISCPVCFKLFNERQQRPISLGCGHTVCKSCIKNRLTDNRCPFDQSVLPSDVDKLPANFALMHLVGAAVPEQEKEATKRVSDNPKSYEQARKCIEEMAVHLKPLAENASDDDSSTCSDHNPSKIHSHSATSHGLSSTNTTNSTTTTSTRSCVLSRPMQRKLISLIHCQLLEEEGRSRAARIARSLGERIVSELLVLHQSPHQLSANLWAAVRTRGCQFLGPAMQEEVLKLILLALEDGSFLSRKVLVLFVVQRLESRYPQASKTAIGHVVQLLYRASCFKVLKREEESSLMQLKDEFRQYESLRREHDSQIVQIAIEAGLRISPEQWSSLLYGDPAHKSHMQSIIDKHQSPQSFAQSIAELMLALQRTSDNSGLLKLQPQLEFVSNIDPSPDCPAPSWENLEAVMRSLNIVMGAFVEFLSQPDYRARLEAAPVQNSRYKTSMCRDFSARGTCPRGNTCTFAHSQEELERYRSRSRRSGTRGMMGVVEKTSSSLSPSESDQLRQIQLLSTLKAEAAIKNGSVMVEGGNGKTSSVVELLGPKLAAGSTPATEVGHMLSQLTLGQPAQGSAMSVHQKLVCAGEGWARANQWEQSEKPSVIPLGADPSLVPPRTHLTFSRPGVDGAENTTVGPQTCLHQHGPATYGQSPHVPSPLTSHSLFRRAPPAAFPLAAHGHTQPQTVSPQLGALKPQPGPVLPLVSGVEGAVPACGASGPCTVSVPVSGLTSQQVAEIAKLCAGGCLPCLPTQPQQGPDLCAGLTTPQLLPYHMQAQNTLEDLNCRKQQIIHHLQGDSVFLEPRSPVYLADGRPGFAGLKTVLDNNKKNKEAMPKPVSDMFVATRSTQCLDELLHDEGCTNWSSSAEDVKPALSAAAASSNNNNNLGLAGDVARRELLPWSCSSGDCGGSGDTTRIATVSTSVPTPDSSFQLFVSGEWSSGQATSVSSSGQALCAELEFCSFPGDDGDENFIPFEQTSVSKFGPISRLSKSKTNNSAPVQVTADSCKRMTPVLAVTPLERPMATSTQFPSRFPCPELPEHLHSEPVVKPSPTEIPSMWQQSPQPSYLNIARLKAGALDAVTNSERLAYELQAVELEIAMKTGKSPQPVGRILQEAVMSSPQAGHGSAGGITEHKGTGTHHFMSVLGHGHVTDCLTTLPGGENPVSPHRAAAHMMDDFHRSWQGIKK